MNNGHEGGSLRKRRLAEKKQLKRQRREERRQQKRETEREVNNLIVGAKS